MTLESWRYGDPSIAADRMIAESKRKEKKEKRTIKAGELELLPPKLNWRPLKSTTGFTEEQRRLIPVEWLEEKLR